MIQRGQRLLPKDIPDHGDLLAKILHAEGVDVRLGSPAVKVRRGGDGVEVWTEAGAKVTRPES